jgi:hypothetical protein
MNNPKKQSHNDLIGMVERKKRRTSRMNINKSLKRKSPCPIDHLSDLHPGHGFLEHHGLAADLPSDLAPMREELGINVPRRRLMPLSLYLCHRLPP